MNGSRAPHNATGAVEDAMRLIAISTNALVLGLGLAGNGLVIWITTAGRAGPPTFPSACYLHLAVADLLFSAGRIPAIVQEVLRSRWPFGRALCKLHSFTRYLVVFAGVFVLTLISLHRCLLVAQPVWVRNHHRPRLGCWLITGAWILAICFSIPYLVVRDVETKRGESFCVYRTDLRHFVEMPLRLSRFLGGFLIPFAIIATSYVVLIWKLRRRSWVGSQRTFALVLAVVALFFVCWLPHHVLVLLSTYQKKKEIWGVALKLANALAYLHSCLNPVLYGLVGFTRSKGRRRGSFLGIFRRALAEEEEGSSEMKASQSTRRTS
ncbi:C3a anaphylatoxin chemotactic receptor-like [Gopherus flavomarginatus]|uniref:C3a anaphylatoxin chemotactic receptor-like n=1 Tax=Gopherus flavomarginatus TaxID=286002 RepID=UPI0021CC1EE7|nr:C3a anaphylatoxin chemotactic receptor-like [Gopherus flavomarginatus]XP_050786728.1 C3a anaphylatoxin chemotactic receptor-like [Gopherus flavomarginatus]